MSSTNDPSACLNIDICWLHAQVSHQHPDNELSQSSKRTFTIWNVVMTSHTPLQSRILEWAQPVCQVHVKVLLHAQQSWTESRKRSQSTFRSHVKELGCCYDMPTMPDLDPGNERSNCTKCMPSLNCQYYMPKGQDPGNECIVKHTVNAR